jgi:hypothetical protein
MAAAVVWPPRLVGLLRLSAAGVALDDDLVELVWLGRTIPCRRAVPLPATISVHNAGWQGSMNPSGERRSRAGERELHCTMEVRVSTAP